MVVIACLILLPLPLPLKPDSPEETCDRQHQDQQRAEGELRAAHGVSAKGALDRDGDDEKRKPHQETDKAVSKGMPRQRATGKTKKS